MTDLTRYQIGKKLNAFDQLKLTRKLAPAFPLIDGLIKDENKEKPKSILIILMLGMISDDAVKEIIDLCLSCVYVSQEQGIQPAPLYVNGRCMFDDVKMDEILELTAKVIEVNIGDFLNTALLSLKG